MAFKRDTEALREFLQGHSVRGYEVEAPIFGPSTIDQQISTPGGFMFYKVIPDKPMPFGKFANELNVPDRKMDLATWKEKFVYGSKSMPVMAVDLMEQLEAGGEVSQRDILFRQLMDTGCLDIDQNVLCYTFDSRYVKLRVLRKGMAVEIEDEDETGWPGKIVGISGKTVLVEQFSPVPFMRTPQATQTDKIKPGFYSKEVYTLGYGIIDGFEEQGRPIPPGKWDKDNREYELESPMPVSEIAKFCETHYPNAPMCLLQALILFILPIDSAKVEFKPLPEGRDPAEYLVEYEG